MNRLQLFEFEDFHWFPDLFRSPMTRLLAVLNEKMGLDEAVTILIENIVERTGLQVIVDLGSGSGGVMPVVHDKLNSDEGDAEIKFILTDLHPSKESIQSINSISNESLSYYPQSVDATKLEAAPKGVKTMINSFHHMDADSAKSILESAQDSGDPILIFEMQEKKIPIIIWLIFLPLGLLITFMMALVLTLFSRPITITQLIFTYLIPIIPLCFAWDGQVSYARMYSMKDYDSFLDGLGGKDYIWKKGVGQKRNGKPIGTFLLGMPASIDK